MRKLLIAVFVLWALAEIGVEISGRGITCRIRAQSGSFAPLCPVAPQFVRPARTGERIEYDVKLGAIKLGRSVFRQVESSRLGETQADVFIFETKLFHFSDTEKIYGDPISFLPLRVERDIYSWPKKETITEEYDQKAFLVRLTGNGSNQEIKSSGPLQNAILLPFSLREYPVLEPGWSAKVNLPTQKFTITLAGKEKVRVPAGEFETYHFKSDPDKFEIWVTADASRIPVKIRGTGALGYTMFMTGYTQPLAGQQRVEKK
jgi:hypothetical protein